ncbi:hypothetical protein DH2020_016709 [Rehmannia glutinosa]|uniref:J domain-containing protein n=1 Tax=Rehmannia glutinosa TaxID=99300 RepID=A0ABR0WPW4_REHGL
MGKRSKARASEEHIEDEDEEMEEDREYFDGSSSSNEKSLYENTLLIHDECDKFKWDESKVDDTDENTMWICGLKLQWKFTLDMNKINCKIEILGVEKTASQQEIKKAYYKLALRLHPDKNPDNEEAKEKFQQLQKVMSILGDEEKRAVYDQTGCVDDADLAGDVIQNLQTFFRAMYKKVTEADIEEFEANYRGSDSEKKDLLELYKKLKGNMEKYFSILFFMAVSLHLSVHYLIEFVFRLFCCMLCSDSMLDSHRFKDMIDEAISAGELKSTKTYEKWAKKVSKTKPPTSPLRRRKKSKKNSEDLYAIIAQRQTERKGKIDSMFSSLVQKYGGGESVPEPSEEEFEAARRKLESRRTSKRK